MTQTGRRARVVHAIPGRLRIRFEGQGLTAAPDGLAAVRVAPGILSIDAKPAARSIVLQYDPAQTTEALVLAELDQAGIAVVRPVAAPPSAPTVVPETTADAQTDDSGKRRELWEMLVGPPPKLDRRFAESLMLSAVSLLAARRVGLALGGGTTLPAYFAIWFALRRMTGLGRRR